LLSEISLCPRPPVSAIVIVPAPNDRIIVTMNGILDDALSDLLLLCDCEGINSNNDNDSEDRCATQSSNDSSTTPPSNESNTTHTSDDSSVAPTSSPPKKKRKYKKGSTSFWPCRWSHTRWSTHCHNRREEAERWNESEDGMLLCVSQMRTSCSPKNCVGRTLR
jgi:hypothetical protein